MQIPCTPKKTIATIKPTNEDEESNTVCTAVLCPNEHVMFDDSEQRDERFASLSTSQVQTKTACLAVVFEPKCVCVYAYVCVCVCVCARVLVYMCVCVCARACVYAHARKRLQNSLM